MLKIVNTVLYIFILVATLLALIFHANDSPKPLLFSLIGIIAILIIKLVIANRQSAKLMHWLAELIHQKPQPINHLYGYQQDCAEYVLRVIEQHKSELKISKDKLNRLFKALSQANFSIILLDKDKIIEWFNVISEQYFGFLSEQDFQQNVLNLIRTPDFEKFIKSKAFREPFSFEFNNRQLSISAASYDQNRLLLITHDISQNMSAEKLRTQFIANVSHELRTPLTVIVGFLETLQNIELTKAETNRIIELMQKQSAQMVGLINDLLIITKLENSQSSPLNQWFALDDLLISIQESCQQLNKKQHQINFDFSKNIQIAGNENEIRSAITNLLTNAINYTESPGLIQLNTSLSADKLLINVSDNGNGIEPHHIIRLTERFYRVDKGRSKNQGGTGLGLSIVKHVMQHHDGSLEIASSLGKGSTFSLSLPKFRFKIIQEQNLAS